MIKAGDEVVALVSAMSTHTKNEIIRGQVYVVRKRWVGEKGQDLISLEGQVESPRGWPMFIYSSPTFRKVTRPLSSASSELTKKLTEEVREGEKKREIEYEPMIQE